MCWGVYKRVLGVCVCSAVQGGKREAVCVCRGLDDRYEAWPLLVYECVYVFGML